IPRGHLPLEPGPVEAGAVIFHGDMDPLGMRLHGDAAVRRTTATPVGESVGDGFRKGCEAFSDGHLRQAKRGAYEGLCAV
ncbi:MAG TPA: hypothetical protein PLY56_16215, partial [Armatimonadota bacterium]|nr:hypothetical protein [Armatimonadota bacterium]